MENTEKCLNLADSNLIYSIRNRMGHIEGAKFIDGDGYVIFTIGVDNLDGHLNGGICIDDSKAEEFLDHIDCVFKPLKRSYSIWIRGNDNEKLEGILKSRGLSPARLPGAALMTCRDKIDSEKLSESFYIRMVRNNKGLEDFKKVIMNAFDKEESVADVMINLRMISNPRCEGMIIYEKSTDRPVAAGCTVLSDGIAGIYYIGTADEFRGRGLGGYIAQETTNLGFKVGAKMVILQASEEGERIYKRLGYETIGYYRSYRIEF